MSVYRGGYKVIKRIAMVSKIWHNLPPTNFQSLWSLEITTLTQSHSKLISCLLNLKTLSKVSVIIWYWLHRDSSIHLHCYSFSWFTVLFYNFHLVLYSSALLLMAQIVFAFIFEINILRSISKSHNENSSDHDIQFERTWLIIYLFSLFLSHKECILLLHICSWYFSCLI